MPIAKSLLFCVATCVMLTGAALANSALLPAPGPAAAPALPFVTAEPVLPVLVRVAQADDAVETRFAWSATKTAEGIAFDGNAPNAAIKSDLMGQAGQRAVDHTKIARGAPDNFAADAVAALGALNNLDTGRVAYTGVSWTLGGFAPSPEARDALLATLGDEVDLDRWLVAVGVSAPDTTAPDASAPDVTIAEDVSAPDATAPDVTTLETTESGTSAAESATEAPVESAESEVPANVAEPFKWSVAKAENGEITFDGRVPTEALKASLDAAAGPDLTDSSEVGGVAPDDFAAISAAAIDALSALDKGRIAYTGYGWTFGGFAPDHDTIDSVLENLGAVTDLHQWLVFIEVTPAPVEAETATPAQEEQPAPAQAEQPAPVEAEQPSPAETEKPALAPDVQFNALKSDGLVTLSGDVSSEVFGRYASLLANGAATDALSVADSLNYTFNDAAEAGLTALQSLDSGLLAFENGDWSLTGDAIGADNADAARALIAALPDGDSWQIDIAVTPAFELCADAVDQFSNTHTILFAPGSSLLADESANALVTLVSELKQCPAADLYVEGYTDSDGPAETNMALSVARSESVIAHLIDLGLDETRLYAVGYGETLPVASNDTAAGKAQNRRIVFRLVKE